MIPIARPDIGPEEFEAVREVLGSGMLAQGKRVAEVRNPPAEAGLNRASWNLRFDAPTPRKEDNDPESPIGIPGAKGKLPYEIALAAVGRQEARHEADEDDPLDRGERSGRQT